MKTCVNMLVAGTILAFAIASIGQTNTGRGPVAGFLPITGMTASELTRFFDEIKGQLPPTAKVISLSVISGTKVVMRTGGVEAPLAGSGELITWEFKNDKGKWVVTERHDWVS